MRPQVYVVAAILVIQNFSIPRHQHRNGIGKQKHTRSDRSRKAIKLLVANSDILQFHCVHQVMKCDMCIAAAQASQQRRHQPPERDQRIPAEGAEQQVEPNNVGLQTVQSFQQAVRTGRIIERPTTNNRKAIQFRALAGQLICQNGQAEEGITLQLLSNMESILA
jgi:hypothetical protein